MNNESLEETKMMKRLTLIVYTFTSSFCLAISGNYSNIKNVNNSSIKQIDSIIDENHMADQLHEIEEEQLEQMLANLKKPQATSIDAPVYASILTYKDETGKTHQCKNIAKENPDLVPSQFKVDLNPNMEIIDNIDLPYCNNADNDHLAQYVPNTYFNLPQVAFLGKSGTLLNNRFTRGALYCGVQAFFGNMLLDAAGALRTEKKIDGTYEQGVVEGLAWMVPAGMEIASGVKTGLDSLKVKKGNPRQSAKELANRLYYHPKGPTGYFKRNLKLNLLRGTTCTFGGGALIAQRFGGDDDPAREAIQDDINGATNGMIRFLQWLKKDTPAEKRRLKKEGRNKNSISPYAGDENDELYNSLHSKREELLLKEYQDEQSNYSDDEFNVPEDEFTR